MNSTAVAHEDNDGAGLHHLKHQTQATSGGGVLEPAEEPEGPTSVARAAEPVQRSMADAVTRSDEADEEEEEEEGEDSDEHPETSWRQVEAVTSRRMIRRRVLMQKWRSSHKDQGAFAPAPSSDAIEEDEPSWVEMQTGPWVARHRRGLRALALGVFAIYLVLFAYILLEKGLEGLTLYTLAVAGRDLAWGVLMGLLVLLALGKHYD